MKDLAGKAFDVAATLDYQNDAVVSREILKKNTGTVTRLRSRSRFERTHGSVRRLGPYRRRIGGDLHRGKIESRQKGRDDHHAGEQTACPEGRPKIQDGLGDDQSKIIGRRGAAFDGRRLPLNRGAGRSGRTDRPGCRADAGSNGDAGRSNDPSSRRRRSPRLFGRDLPASP
jgi:hypothetical protein